MTTITAPDGTVVATRQAYVHSLNVMGVEAAAVAVGHSQGNAWVNLGPVGLHGIGATVAEQLAHLAEVGRAITHQAIEAAALLAAPESTPDAPVESADIREAVAV